MLYCVLSYTVQWQESAFHSILFTSCIKGTSLVSCNGVFSYNYAFIILQCSQSCGGGIQAREALCKQRLSDGSILELPETFCSSTKPATQELCHNEDCPPEWSRNDWSQVIFKFKQTFLMLYRYFLLGNLVEAIIY